MTKEEAEKYFKDNSNELSDYIFTFGHTELLYQAFKARLKSEAVLNVWPEEK